ncbi:hypothetical protein J2W32_000953 [Variovorax boronicumulans]|uniref:Uncharacterized protein n=1 Tax=Variovorax boronicumulans TaxID=436515 RepID=A0AAW8CY31_9BURK|nr:hypothetical protein [Variovorax boronicumulans]MDP9892602.1 hypothetical protein [Variovorax boronicumulans]MDQ0051917.1 hypothetical protein [Variovorax boronicumulans]
MKTVNGIQVFDHGEVPPLPEGAPLEAGFESKWGYKLAKNGPDYTWVAGTEDDYRLAEGKYRGIAPEKVDIQNWCSQTAPMSCSGDCTGVIGGSCQLKYSPYDGGYYFCSCT